MKKIVALSLMLATTTILNPSVECAKSRTHVNYELRQGHTVVYRGITNDMKRRVTEHRASGKKFTSVNKVGSAKTRAGARVAEKKSLQQYRNSHHGKNPKYNQARNG